MGQETTDEGLKCRNCSNLLMGNFCVHCGQSARSSQRLTVREIMAKGAEAVLDADAVFPATFLGLWVDPGNLCRDYVEGKRKRFLNPFTYLLIAITVQIVFAKVISFFAWDAKEASDSPIPEDAITWVLLLAAVPLAMGCTIAFRSSGRNLAENYVLALFITAQFVWIEILFLPFPTTTLLDIIQGVAYFTSWLAILTWAGARFYSMHWLSVFWRMAVVNLAVLILGLVVAIIAITILDVLGIWPADSTTTARRL